MLTTEKLLEILFPIARYPYKENTEKNYRLLGFFVPTLMLDDC